jgi:hypothetical protein
MEKENFDCLFIPAIPLGWMGKIQAPIGGAAFRVALYIWFKKGVTYIRQVDVMNLAFLLIAFFKRSINLYYISNWLTYDSNLMPYISNESFLQ